MAMNYINAGQVKNYLCLLSTDLGRLKSEYGDNIIYIDSDNSWANVKTYISSLQSEIQEYVDELNSTMEEMRNVSNCVETVKNRS